MMKVLLPLIVSVLLVGCASSEVKQAQAQLMQAQAKAVEQPLVGLEFYADGKIKNLVVGRQNTSVAMPQDETQATIRSVVGGIVTVGSIAAGGRAAAGLVHAVGDVAGKISGPVTNTTTTTTTDSHDTGSRNVSTDSHDATATPTVVMQPAPVIVPPTPTVVP